MRDAARFFHDHLHLEPELGLAQRFGQQHETEAWAALFFRYRGFPWDDKLITSVAASTGINYAFGISETEQERARDGQGSRWMHFFLPEITFAPPAHPNVELVFPLPPPLGRVRARQRRPGAGRNMLRSGSGSGSEGLAALSAAGRATGSSMPARWARDAPIRSLGA